MIRKNKSLELDIATWKCIACGAEELSRREPWPCPCGAERSWFVDATDSTEHISTTPCLATDIPTLDIPLFRVRHENVDDVLGGGFAPGVVLVHGPQASGKTRLTYRWATRRRSLIACSELDARIVREILLSCHAEIRNAHIIARETLDGWKCAADSIGSKTVVLDSLASERDPIETLKDARDWAQTRDGVVFAIQHETKAGSPRGASGLAYWCDYELRITRTSDLSTIAILKNRLAPAGTVTLRL